MKDKSSFIPFAFAKLEESAKDLAISDKDLCDMLTDLLEYLEYRQGACELYLQRVIRARKITVKTVSEALTVFKNISDLSYPPAKNATESRCNAEGVPAFYCSVDNAVPIFETRPQVGDFLALTTYKNFTGGVKLLMPPIGIVQLQKALSNRNANDAMVRILNEFTHFKTSATHTFLKTDEKLSQWFTASVNESNKYLYRLTNAFFQMFLKRVSFDNERPKALIYPSVESEITGYNIVMEPDLMDANFNFECSIIYEVVAKNGKSYKLRPVKDAYTVLPGGEIQWKDHSMINHIWKLDPQSPSLFNNGDGTF